MSLTQIADAIHHRIAVDIGVERGSTIRHFLLYSSTDDQFFVAIRDDRSSAVITIRPFDESGWGPTNEQKELAKVNAMARRDITLGHDVFDHIRVPKHWPQFRVAMNLPNGERFRITLPGKWDVSSGFKRLFSDPEFQKCLLPAIEEILDGGGSIKGFALKRNGEDFKAAEKFEVDLLRAFVADKRAEVDLSGLWFEERYGG